MLTYERLVIILLSHISPASADLQRVKWEVREKMEKGGMFWVQTNLLNSVNNVEQL